MAMSRRISTLPLLAGYTIVVELITLFSLHRPQPFLDFVFFVCVSFDVVFSCPNEGMVSMIQSVSCGVIPTAMGGVSVEEVELMCMTGM
jgi:hypothetical protein